MFEVNRIAGAVVDTHRFADEVFYEMISLKLLNVYSLSLFSL
jgi:hypothetical protein